MRTGKSAPCPTCQSEIDALLYKTPPDPEEKVFPDDDFLLDEDFDDDWIDESHRDESEDN